MDCVGVLNSETGILFRLYDSLNNWLLQKSRWVLALSVFVLQIIWAWPIRDIYLSLQDEGNILSWASRIQEGQLPYRDFQLRFMPGTALVLRIAFGIFGDSIEVARWYFLISLGLVASIIWLISDRLVPRAWTLLPVLCFFSVGGQVWPMLSPHWDANITALGALLAAEQSTRRTHLIASGFLAGLTVLLLQPKGAVICVALAAVAMLRSSRWERLALVIAGAAIPGAIFTSWLLSNGIFTAFWEQAVAYNLTSYSSFQRYPFEWGLALQQLKDVTDGFHQLGKIPFLTWLLWFLTALSFALVDIVKYTLFVPVLLVGIILCKRPRPERELLIGLVVFLILSTYLSWVRATRYHFNFHTPAWYPLLTYLLYSLWAYQRRTATTLTALILFVFTWHGIDSRNGWAKYVYPINFSRGLLYSDSPVFARSSRELSETLSRRFAHKPVFGFPEVPMILWLSRCHNPTSFEVLAPIFYPDKDFVRARSELEKAAPCGILFRPSGAAISGNYPGLSTESYIAKERELSALLLRGSVPVLLTSDFQLFELSTKETQPDLKTSPKQ